MRSLPSLFRACKQQWQLLHQKRKPCMDKLSCSFLYSCIACVVCKSYQIRNYCSFSSSQEKHSLAKHKQCRVIIILFDEMTMSEPPPPAPPTGLLMKRCKFIWRLLLLSNLALGAFLFASAKRRDSVEITRRTAQKSHKGKASVEVPPEPITSSIDLNYDDFFLPVTTPVQRQAPIPEELQREIFQWMLEEKRKLKPKNPVEKKQIDEEKAILKQFLRAKSLPKVLEKQASCQTEPNGSHVCMAAEQLVGDNCIFRPVYIKQRMLCKNIIELVAIMISNCIAATSVYSQSLMMHVLSAERIALLSGYTAKKNYIFLLVQAMEYSSSSRLSYCKFSKLTTQSPSNKSLQEMR
ncbi:hypothetical protein VNO80_22348 [Phaseolus coccineus]|uniref:Uncharacterized protein n=1 Tax=Phaseolus coccineus TaxID=3886 RepID=A0AAN9QU67_PHACN